MVLGMTEKLFVDLKDAVFEQLSFLLHLTELNDNVLWTRMDEKSVFLLSAPMVILITDLLLLLSSYHKLHGS